MKTKAYFFDISTPGLKWMTREGFLKNWKPENLSSLDGLEYFPFFITDAFSPQYSIQSLILGTVYIYGLEEDMIKIEEEKLGIKIGGLKENYKKALLSFFNPPEEFNLEHNALNVLYTLRSQKGSEFALDFYKNLTELLQTSKTYSDYVVVAIDYLSDHTEARKEVFLNELLKTTKYVKQEEVDPNAWKVLFIVKACLEGLLGFQEVFLEGVDSPKIVKAIKEKKYEEVLFGDEYL